MSKPSTSKSKQSAEGKDVRIIPIEIEEEVGKGRKLRYTTKSKKEHDAPEENTPVKEAPVEQPTKCEKDDEFTSEDVVLLTSDEDQDASKKDAIRNEILERALPQSTVPEKIIIILDTALDENASKFLLSDGSAYTPLEMLKRGLQIFLHNKQLINSSHEYALIILDKNKAYWALNFTRKISNVLEKLCNLNECSIEDVFDLNSVFDVINENVHIPDKNLNPDAYVVRAIFIYSRSYTIPSIKRTEEIDKLLNSQYFTFDVVMTHEPPSTENNCTKISNILQNLDTKGFAYFFSVSRHSNAFLTAMGKLLSHPLQRPLQNQAKYVLSEINE